MITPEAWTPVIINMQMPRSMTYVQGGKRWFSRYVIAAMLVDGKQKMAH